LQGVYVKDLTNIVVKTVPEIDRVLQIGQKNRSVGATLMNQDSSRSHSIFTIIIETSAKGADGKPHIKAGKLNLVDLAGSERQGKTGATGERLKEATKINLSLSALGNCISALVDGKSSHVPYRDSKLTRMLEDSLGGNTKTCMIATCGPADYNYDETLSTLRYANRAKSIKNKPRINEDPKDTMLREMQDEIARLKAAIETQGKGGVKPPKKKKSGGGAGGGGSAGGPNVEKKIVYKEVVEERLIEGATDEEIKAFADAMDEDKLKLKEKLEAEEAERQLKAAEAEEAEQKLNEADEEADLLAEQLQQLEAKILHNQGLGDANAEAALDLRRKQAESERLRSDEQALAEALAEKEEGLLEQDENFRTLEEAVQFKTQLLEKRFKQYQEVKTDIMDIQEEYAEEREDLLETIRSMTKQLKLKHAVIENFVVPADVEKMEERCQWDEDAEKWILEKRTAETGGIQIRSQRPQSALGTRTHQTRTAIVGASRGATRFKSENVITLELEMPERTTFDYDPSYFNGNLEYSSQYGLQGGNNYHHEQQAAYGDQQQYYEEEGYDPAQYDQLNNFQDSMHDGGGGGDMYEFDAGGRY